MEIIRLFISVSALCSRLSTVSHKQQQCKMICSLLVEAEEPVTLPELLKDVRMQDKTGLVPGRRGITVGENDGINNKEINSRKFRL